MNLAPQTLQLIKAVLVQPGLKFAIGFDFFLEGFKRFNLGREIGQFGRLIVHGLLLISALLVQLRRLFF